VASVSIISASIYSDKSWPTFPLIMLSIVISGQQSTLEGDSRKEMNFIEWINNLHHALVCS